MIGVILWRDVAEGKAVVWCEDQGDLAFCSRHKDMLDAQEPLDVGDVVRFEVEFENNVRIARNVTRLLENWGNLLPNSLNRLPAEPDSVTEGEGANIVPLRAFTQRTANQEGKRNRIRRHG